MFLLVTLEILLLSFAVLQLVLVLVLVLEVLEVLEVLKKIQVEHLLKERGNCPYLAQISAECQASQGARVESCKPQQVMFLSFANHQSPTSFD